MFGYATPHGFEYVRAHQADLQAEARHSARVREAGYRGLFDRLFHSSSRTGDGEITSARVTAPIPAAAPLAAEHVVAPPLVITLPRPRQGGSIPTNRPDQVDANSARTSEGAFAGTR